MFLCFTKNKSVTPVIPAFAGTRAGVHLTRHLLLPPMDPGVPGFRRDRRRGDTIGWVGGRARPVTRKSGKPNEDDRCPIR